MFLTNISQKATTPRKELCHVFFFFFLAGGGGKERMACFFFFSILTFAFPFFSNFFFWGEGERHLLVVRIGQPTTRRSKPDAHNPTAQPPQKFHLLYSGPSTKKKEKKKKKKGFLFCYYFFFFLTNPRIRFYGEK